MMFAERLRRLIALRMFALLWLKRVLAQSAGGLGRMAAVLALAAGVLLAPGLSVAHAVQAEAFEWDAKVVRGQLPNGLSYYVVRVAGARNQVGMQLLVRVGSLDERDDQSGVAHMVEHMVFHATPRHPQGLQAFLQQQGLQVGQHYNAQTNYQRTQYTLALDATAAKVATGLEVLRNIAGSASIPEEGLERERLIILEEWRMKLGVRERMERQRRALLRAGSLYPERPTIGSEASIRSQTAHALRAFYRDWYRPNNMALIVVGDVDPQALVPAIQRQFADLEEAPLPARNPVNAALGESLRIARMQDPESGTSQVGWVQRFMGDHRQDSEGLRQRLIDRLAERLARSAAVAQAAHLPQGVESLTVRKGELGGQVESLGFAASVGPQGHRQGLEQILQLQARLLRPLDTQALATELQKIQRLNDQGVAVRDRRDLQGWMQALGEAVAEQGVVQDAQQKQRQVATILPSLTAAAVQERLRAWMDSPDRLVYMLAPGQTPLQLPTVADVLAEQQRQFQQASHAANGVEATEVARRAPPPGASVDSAALATSIPSPAQSDWPVLPSAGAIIQERVDDVHGVLEWGLGNGDRVVWLRAPAGVTEQPSRMQIVAQSGAGYRREGASAWEWQAAAQLARQADWNGQAPGGMKAWEQAHKLAFSQEHTETHLRWSAQFSPDQAADAMAWLAARQTAVHWSASDVQTALQQLLRQQARRPYTVAGAQASALQQLRWGDLDNSDSPPSQQRLEALLQDAQLPGRWHGLWQDMAAQPMTYFVMGPMEPTALRPLVERYLAGIARTQTPAAAQPLLQRPGARHSVLPIAIEPQASVQGHGSQALAWSAPKAMGVAVLARAIQRTLRTELREKESGVYRLQFSMTLNPATQRLESDIRFTADPQRVRALWERTLRVLADVPHSLDDAVLEREIRTMQQQERARATDAATQFQRLQLSVMQWGDARYLSQSAALQASLTLPALQALLREMQLTQDFCSVLVVPGGAVDAVGAVLPPSSTQEGGGRPALEF